MIFPPRNQSLASSRRRVLQMAVFSRITILLLAALFDALIPDHNPGDDVLRFDLEVDESTIWKLFLQPLTKWDSARFLHLALEPRRRDPMFICASSFNSNDCTTSEQAHAFFPLLPWLIRQWAQISIKIIPKFLLPNSIEGIMVLSACQINFIAFTGSALLLHDLTFSMVKPISTQLKATYLAGVTATLFVINPASIFFTVAYSESIFFFLTTMGYVLYQRGYSLFSSLPWTLASATRSNGSVVLGFLFLECLRQTLAGEYRLLLTFPFMVTPILYSVLWHDRNGYNFHCASGDVDKQCDGISSFYSYVQQKHWNVGFLKYYELKQIPNFLLAFFILFYSTMAVATWIRSSFKRQRSSSNSSSNVITWAFAAFKESTRSPPSPNDNDSLDFLLGPNMLSYDAVLCVAALVGLTVAHVQISTRLICSTCPAIYWYLAYLILLEEKESLFLLRKWAVLLYCFGFTIAGCILHPNFLPWT